MDALKKAEQEKRDAAKRLQEGEGSAPSLVVEGAPLEEPTVIHPVVDSSAADSAADNPTPALSLSPIAATGEHPVPPPPAEEFPVEDGRHVPALSSGALELDVTGGTPEQVSGERTIEHSYLELSADDADRTFHGVPIDEGKPVPGLYEETVQGEPYVPGEPSVSYEETLPGVSAIQLAKDIGTADQPTPVAAQTVFSAGESKRRVPAIYKWGIPGAAIVLIIAVGVWVHFIQTPVTRNLLSPMVAQGIEAVPPAADIGMLPAVREEIVSGAFVGDPALSPAPLPEGEGGRVSTLPEGSGGTMSTLPEKAEGTVAAREETGAGTLIGDSAVSPAPLPAGAGETVAALDETGAGAIAGDSAFSPAPLRDGAGGRTGDARPGVLPERIEPPPSAIRISRAAGPAEEARLVREAHDYYRGGNLAGARAHYVAVLERQPDNVDALLGLGAVSLREGDTVSAMGLLSRVLRLNPRNETARAILIGMQRDADAVSRESALKNLIHEHPDLPYLHFALGNVYAEQRRWAEAQQAFFDAYRNDAGNPDYALNLAVSLDRLGQYPTALDYYNVALRLADERAAGFDPSGVLSRIRELGQAQAP
jgi:Flp pilus assembly protein TadD